MGFWKKVSGGNRHTERGWEVHESYMNIFFQKKSSPGKMEHFGHKNGTSSKLWVQSKGCF